MPLDPKIGERLRQAVKHFWGTRETQSQKQGARTGSRDAGARTAVTGGRQMDGFVSLVRDYLCESGLPRTRVYCEKRIELPGWYRSEKKRDLLIVENGQLLAAIEFKSQIGSFGNNFNNRTEEAIGSACDLWAAYREGAFKPSARPWLGYLMLLEEAPGSLQPVRAKEPHFKVFPEFKNASYAKRYEILLTKLVRERLYDSACFLLSSAKNGGKGAYKEPCDELDFEKFAASLLARAVTIAKTKG
ncbi:MAG TPA: PaeR7I family type II restriction endonuclease [Candidatus Acidoferrales bacterium]|nr:PaeR7I family type II restriction endonuclease [Candidatus Acidoferrales bacterium]